MDNEFLNFDDEYELATQNESDFLKELSEGLTKSRQSQQTVNVPDCQPSTSKATEKQCVKNLNKPIIPDCQPSTSKDLDVQFINNVGINKNIILEPNEPEQQRKRTYDELFGDITDLLGTDVFPDIQEPKEKRPRWDEPDDIIEKVLFARELLHSENISSSTQKEFIKDVKKDSISLRVPHWNFVAITRPHDSQRIYIRIRKEKARINQSKHISNLLSMPYQQLKLQAEEIIVKNVERASVTVSAPPSRKIKEDKLWVDKYRPRTYIELLSEETVNRQFLHWLKLWDKVVFNRNPILNTKRKQTVTPNNKQYEHGKEFEELDGKGIPVHKVVLLSGPPGLGKTTLAHVVAQHAGYNVVEINASDDRSPDAFRQALLASTQMKAVMGANPKPNCLILDEIDGAPAPSIDILLRFIQGKLFGAGKKNKEKSVKQSNSAQRPIICICNEPYTPSLRPLRAVALIIAVPEVTPSRLANRLMDIARKENLNVNRDALLTLAKRSGCDVRSCLSGLQYMGGSNLGDNPSLGVKDTRKGLFESWREILMVPMNKTLPVSFSERVKNILDIVHTDETEKLAQGVFHNYPEVCSKKLQNISLSLEWFQYFDNIVSIVMSQQNWSLMPYTNYSFVAWHLYLSNAQNPKLSYPTASNEANQKLARNNSILTAIQQSCGRDVLTLVTDFAPLLPEILTPRLRTVSGHLFSSKEKSDLTNLLNILLDFGLTFVQERTTDGTYDYKLDPNILEIGIFPEIKTRRSLTYAVKQIVAQELETERLRRLSNATGINSRILASDKKDTRKESNDVHDGKSSKSEQENENTSTTIPNHLRKLNSNVTQLKDVVYKDFFGRVISVDEYQLQQKQKNTESQKISPQRSSSRDEKVSARVKEFLKSNSVWYKYKEGYSNAVRRTVLMQDLL